MGYMRQEVSDLHGDGRKLRDRISAMFKAASELTADLSCFHSNLAENSTEADEVSGAIDQLEEARLDLQHAGRFVDRGLQSLPDPDSINDGSDVVSMRRW